MDNDTFSSMVEYYTDFAYHMMGNTADAGDVVQDAFLSSYRARDRFRRDAQVTRGCIASWSIAP
jgi:DNA-directed RNA polymerase specialized sigma24 family protein